MSSPSPESLGLSHFVEGFFKNAGCQLNWDGKILNVNQVPESIQSYLERKAPYSLVFEPGVSPDSELIQRGSTFLQNIIEYLDTIGKTSLLKLPFDRDYQKEFEHYLSLKNARLTGITKKQQFNSIIRFTFISNIRALNEQKQHTHTIYVQDGELLDFNYPESDLVEGNVKEAPESNIKQPYLIAKEKLKSLIQPLIAGESLLLQKKLEHEKERVVEHYGHEKKEINIQIQKAREQIINLEKQLKKSPSSEHNPIIAKISKAKETLSNLNQPDILMNLDKEEKFFLQDEVRKHSIHVNHKLLNTTLIYYPLTTFTLQIRNNHTAKFFETKFNPLKDFLSPLAICESCKQHPKERWLCSSAHIVCPSCIKSCSSCRTEICPKCTGKKCEFCGQSLCKKCIDKCSSCYKTLCKHHLRPNYVNGKFCCTSCLKPCSKCGQFTDSKHIRKSPSGHQICEKCFRISSIN